MGSEALLVDGKCPSTSDAVKSNHLACSPRGSVTRLYVNGRKLIQGGSIASQIGLLSELAYLFIANAGLSGTVPSQLGTLTRLVHLNFQDNNLTGSLDFLQQLTDLQVLSFNVNQFAGYLPSFIGRKLSNLRTLTLSNNKFTSVIPTSFAQLTRLKALRLNGNELSGATPFKSWVPEVCILTSRTSPGHWYFQFAGAQVMP